jgi:hypothetical protein
LGALYSDWSLKFFEDGNVDVGNQYIIKAERSFVNARFLGLPNAYPYHAHANMYATLAELKNTLEEKVDNYGRALGILSLAENNLSEDNLMPILNLKLKIYGKLKKFENLEKLSLKIATNYSSSSGYSAFISYLLKEEKEERNIVEKESLSIHILGLLSEALGKFPKDDSLLRLNSIATLSFFPSDRHKKIEKLLEWFENKQNDDLTLMFQLAYLLFEDVKIKDSDKIFRELSKISRGNQSLYAVREYFKDDYGQKKVFEGKITAIYDEYNGEILIDEIGKSIYFRPISCLFNVKEEDIVSLNISFSFRGPKAEIIKRP